MLLQAKCKYVINIIGRNHLKLDIKEQVYPKVLNVRLKNTTIVILKHIILMMTTMKM